MKSASATTRAHSRCTRRIARRARRKVQLVSHNNTWLRTNEDPAWVFGYDVFDVPLVSPSRDSVAAVA